MSLPQPRMSPSSAKSSSIVSALENIWSNLPEVLYMSIMACLPIKSLLRSRAVSKEWNQLPLTSLFRAHRASLSGDFMEYVWLTFQRYQKSAFVSCMGGLNLIVDSLDEIYVAQFSKFSVTQVPRLDRRAKHFFHVVGFTVDEETGNYNIFVRFRLACNLRKEADPVYVHRYGSSKRIWSSCGALKPQLFRCIPVYGVVQHRDHYLMLVISPLRTSFPPYHVKVYDKASRRWNRGWSTLPGKVPLALDSVPLFVNHKGRLLLATLAPDRFLWEYNDDVSEWMPVGQIPVDCFEEIGLEVLEN